MIKREAVIFLFVGSTTVLIDLIGYSFLLWLDIFSVNLAKVTGFLAGLAFSYVANKKLTFGHTSHERGSLNRYLFIYGITLAVNVIANAVALHSLPVWENVIVMAFIVATSLSALINFLGMKFFVFRPKRFGNIP